MDFPNFVGPDNQTAAMLQDAQSSINYFVEYDQVDGAKVPKALLGTPGRVDLGNTLYAKGPCRAMYVLPGGTKAVVVCGSACFYMTAATPATKSSRPTFTYQFITNLNSVSGPVRIRDNGAGNTVVLVDGNNLYSWNYTLASPTVTVSSDPAWLGSYYVCEIDGWFIFAQPNSQKFYTSSPVYWNGSGSWDATYYALKDNSSDNIVGIIENNREFWIFGERTSEVWYNAGGNYFPFSRVPGAMLQIGCAAGQSISRWSGGLVWVSQSERGRSDVVVSVGHGCKTITTPAVSYALNQYPKVSDAFGYVYDEEGHEFYVLNLPAADDSWCYDFTTDQWHQRASVTINSPSAGISDGVLHVDRAGAFMNLAGMSIVGDYQTGAIYWQTRSAYVDGPNPLVSIRRCPHIWDKNDRNRMRYNRLQVEFGPGEATSVANPQAILRWSDDGGATWGNEHFAPIGGTGQTKSRSIWRKLGIGRDRVFEVRVSDPVNRDIIGASIQGEPLGS